MVRRVKEWNRLLRNTVESPSLFNLSHRLSNDFQKVSSKLHAAVDRRVSGQHLTSPHFQPAAVLLCKIRWSSLDTQNHSQL